MDLFNIRNKLSKGELLSSIKLRVTYYSRVSTDHIEQKNSLKNQVDHFYEMINDNSNWIYVDGYIDDGIGGTSDVKRDNFMKMIEDAKNNKFDLIITKEISRFSRNTLDSIKYTRELLSYGVIVYFVNDNINTALLDSELRLTIMASFAQDEIRRLSERVKFGMNRAIKNGHILGNNMLYGYTKDKYTNKLRVINSEKVVIQRIYNMYVVEKCSLSKIVKILNNENIKNRNNNNFTTTSLKRLITNPKYKGYYCGKKTEVIDYMTKKVKYFSSNDWIIYKDNNIEPIIKEDMWDIACKRIKERNKKFGNSFKDKEMYKNRYPLSAKIYCKNDSKVFHRRCQCATDITWICGEYLKYGKKVCNSANIRESEIYYILNDIKALLEINLDDVVSMLLNLYKDKNNRFLNNQYKDVEKDKEKILLKKEKLLELNLEGNLSNEEFNKINNKYNKMLEDINKIKIDNTVTNFNNIKNYIISELKENSDEEIIRLFLNKIIALKKSNNTIELDIYLNAKKTIKFNKNYAFKRGKEFSNTKKYLINYEVNFFNITK